MNLLTQEIPFWIVALYLVYMAAVQALPRPDSASGKGYVFLYGFFHALAFNLALAFDPKKKVQAPDGPAEK